MQLDMLKGNDCMGAPTFFCFLWHFCSKVSMQLLVHDLFTSVCFLSKFAQVSLELQWIMEKSQLWLTTIVYHKFKKENQKYSIIENNFLFLLFLTMQRNNVTKWWMSLDYTYFQSFKKTSYIVMKISSLKEHFHFID